MTNMLGITDLDPSMDNNPYSNIDPIWTYGVHQLGHDDGPNQRPHPTLPAAGGRRARDGRLWCSDGRSSGLRRTRATTEDSWGRPSPSGLVTVAQAGGQAGRAAQGLLLLLLLSGGGVKAPIEAGLQANTFSWRGEPPKRPAWSLGLG